MYPGSPKLVASVALGVAICVAAAGVEVAAEPRKPSRAAKRFEKKAKKAYARKRWDDALTAFLLAYEADPHPRFLYNASRASQKKGDFETSIEFLLRYLEAETDPEELADGQAELRIMEARLKQSHAPLDLTTTPAAAMVELRSGRRELAMRAPVSRWLRAGSWRLQVTAAEHKRWEQVVVVEAGVPIKLEVRLKPEGDDGKLPLEEPAESGEWPDEEAEEEPAGPTDPGQAPAVAARAPPTTRRTRWPGGSWICGPRRPGSTAPARPGGSSGPAC